MKSNYELYLVNSCKCVNDAISEHSRLCNNLVYIYLYIIFNNQSPLNQ